MLAAWQSAAVHAPACVSRYLAMPSISYKGASSGVFTSSTAVDKVVSKKEARRFQFRTTTAFEFSKKTVPDAERESYFDVHNAGSSAANKYMDTLMPHCPNNGREFTGYHKDYCKKAPLDFEANQFLRETFGPTRSGNTIILAKTGKPLAIDWSMFKKSEYADQMRKRPKEETDLLRPNIPREKRDTFIAVGAGRHNSLPEPKSLAHDSYSKFSVALPEGKSASYPAAKPQDLLASSAYNFGPQRTIYREMQQHTAKQLAGAQPLHPTWAGGKRSNALHRRSSSQPVGRGTF